MATQTETSIIREAPQLEAIKLQLLKDAAQFATKPLKLPESKVADFSGLQQATTRLILRWAQAKALAPTWIY